MTQLRTVGDLIAALEEYDPETPVMLAHQPTWPLAEQLGGLVGTYDRPYEDDAEPDEDGETVWLVAGGHAWDRSPYAPAWVFEAAEVGR